MNAGREIAQVVLIAREFFVRDSGGRLQLITFEDQWNSDVQAGKPVYVVRIDGVMRVTARVSENKKFTKIRA